jgi:hypothetical protein
VVFPAAAVSVGASIPKTQRDAIGQPWRAGQAPAHLSTEAKIVANADIGICNGGLNRFAVGTESSAFMSSPCLADSDV